MEALEFFLDKTTPILTDSIPQINTLHSLKQVVFKARKVEISTKEAHSDLTTIFFNHTFSTKCQLSKYKHKSSEKSKSSCFFR